MKYGIWTVRWDLPRWGRYINDWQGTSKFHHKICVYGVSNDCSLSWLTQELEMKAKKNRFQIQSKQKEMVLHTLPLWPFKSANVSSYAGSNSSSRSPNPAGRCSPAVWPRPWPAWWRVGSAAGCGPGAGGGSSAAGTGTAAPSCAPAPPPAAGTWPGRPRLCNTKQTTTAREFYWQHGNKSAK